MSYNLTYEIVGAAVRCGVPPSVFRAWPVADQEEILAWLRLEGRIEAVVAEEATRPKKSTGRS